MKYHMTLTNAIRLLSTRLAASVTSVTSISLAAFALALSLGSCTKDPAQNPIAPGKTVTVTLPPLVTEPTKTDPNMSAHTAGAGANTAADASLRATLQTRSAEKELLHVTHAGTPDYMPDPERYNRNSGWEPAPTRAAHPELENVWVLQFSADGTTLQCNNIGTVAENAAPQATLTVTQNCTIYLLANGPATGINPANLAAFEASGYDPTTAAADAPPIYSAKMNNISIETYKNEVRIVAPDGIPPMLWLRPLTATLQVNLLLDVPGWNLASMELFNVSKTVQYAAPTTEIYPTADDANFLYPASGGVGWPCTPVITGDAASGWLATASWNASDNRRGTVAGIFKEKERNHTNAPDHATFVRVTIQSSTVPASEVTLDIYPGGDELTDFNLIRNHTYTLEVIVEGTTQDLENHVANDDRVTLIEMVNLSAVGSANCYIVSKAGEFYTFDARVKGNGKATLKVNDPDVWVEQRVKINPDDDLIAPKPLAPASAFVVWSTGNSLNSIIKDVKVKGGYVSFTTAGLKGEALTAGNALIGVKDASGTLIWSWHIWATDYDPATDDVPYTTRELVGVVGTAYTVLPTPSRSFMMMGRNLGALNNTPGSPESLGLVYQWGRKDPFPSAKTTTSPVEMTPFGESTYPTQTASGYSWTFFEFEDVNLNAPDASIAYAIQHPTTSLSTFHSTSLSDWLAIKTLADQRDYLWGNPNPTEQQIPNTLVGSKSIYDPCPPGYRVPRQDSWTSFSYDTKSAAGSTNATTKEFDVGTGFTFYCNPDNSVSSYYPAEGVRSGEGHINGLTGERGFCWSSSPHFSGAQKASVVAFYSKRLYGAMYGIDRGSCIAVRCARE